MNTKKNSYRYFILTNHLSVLSILIFSSCPFAEGVETEFDVKTLQSMGYTEDIANFFRHEARFLPGMHNVTVSVNSSYVYQLNIKFNNNGELCIDNKVIDKLKLLNKWGKIDESQCLSIKEKWPDATIIADPGSFKVDITLPEEAFDTDKIFKKGQYGGYALLTNYSLFLQKSHSSTYNTEIIDGYLESGINLKNWILRTQGNINKLSDNNRYSYTTQKTYALKAVESLYSTFSFGEISLNSTILATLPIIGAQIYSDSAQNNRGKLIVPIQESAETNATVEVIQQGEVIYRTIVPPGPFSLDNIGNFSNSVDTEVLIIEQDGRQRRIIIPNLATDNLQPLTSNYVIGIGRYHSYNKSNKPLLAAAEMNLLTSTGTNIAIGSMVSSPYQSLNMNGLLSVPISTKKKIKLSSTINVSRTQWNRNGSSLNIQGSANITDQLALSLSNFYQQKNYFTPDQAFNTYIYKDFGANGSSMRNTLSTSLSWAHPVFGNFFYTLSHNQYYGKKQSKTSQYLSTSQPIGRANLNIGAQFNQQGRSYSLTLSLPLGKGSLSARAYKFGNNLFHNYTYQNRINDNNRYSLGYSGSRNAKRINGKLESNTPYARINLGYSQNNQQERSQSLSLNGGVALANNTLVSSSDPIGDTFAIVTLPMQSGLPVSTTHGSGGITNFFGTAVLPSIYPYSQTKAQIDTRKLPLNINLNTTAIDLMLAKGTVFSQRVEVTEQKQLLLTIYNNNKETVPTGLTITDMDDQFLGTTIGDGNFLLVNNDIGKELRLKFTDEKICTIEYQVPEFFDQEALYETADAFCN